MKRMSKRIIGLFICALVVSFASIHLVEAKDETNACNTRPDIKALETPANYGFSLKKSGNSSYTISVNPKSNKSDIQQKLRDVKFSITCNKITSTDEKGNVISQVPVSTGTVDYNTPYTFNASSGAYRCTLSGQSEVKFARADGGEDSCTANVSFSVDVEDGGSAQDVAVKCSNQITEGDGFGTKAIDCNHPNGEFETSFCEAKNGAKAAGKSRYFENAFGAGSSKTTFNAAKGSNTFVKFRCDVQKITASASATTADEKYYVNREYMYGSGEVTKNIGKYRYHFDGAGKVTEGAAVTCKIACEEAVTVEYGAPVASKAGLCFEYKVKVTSRVSCNMVTKPEKPEIYNSYCEPVPGCIHANSSGGSSFYHQGGPNDEFDSCVQACDGGKYTSKCSNSCYKKVYGSTKVSKTGSINTNAKVQKLTDAGSCGNISKPNDACYYYHGENGTINWSCGNRQEGRWYNNHWTGFGAKSLYRLDINGIYRKLHSDGGLCNDSCSWSTVGCSSKYLNPGWAEYDNAENAKMYNEAVKQCQALASCTTSTAEFTISTEYASYSDSVFKEINYPYTSMNGHETDKLSSGENHVSTATAANTTILSYNGCYINKEQRNWYQAEWSFPGSWINNKTGEISYIPKNDGWTEMKKAFCIPLDAKNVNQKWWNWYMRRQIIGQGTSIESQEYQEKCGPYESADSISKITSISTSDIERWNINAKAIKFGYYEWNIHIQCFYALNTNFAMVTTSSSSDGANYCCTSECCGNNCKPQSYRVRSVDLNNMFPDVNGKADSSRAPGFNWSEYASNVVNNPAYQSKPLAYATMVQELGYNVYDSEYLDYYFELSKEDLRRLKGHDYSTFNGKFDTRENGVTTYFSDVIREVHSRKVPAEEAVRKCNNLVNYQSSACQNN